MQSEAANASTASDQTSFAAGSNVFAGTCLFLFIASLAMPIYFDIGQLHLAPYRIVLLIAVIPSFIAFLGSDRTHWKWPDALIIIYALWAAITIFAAHGLEGGWEPAGILVVETLGGYFLARSLITDSSSFRVFSRIFTWLVMITAPFALYESLTSISPIIEFLSRFFNVHPNWDLLPRLGLHRAQVSFEHPILFGVFASAAFGLSWFTFSRRKNITTASLRTIIILGSVFCSLSVGAFLSIICQLGYMAWEWLTKNIKNRWYFLLAAGLLMYAGIDVLSNRTPIEVIISYMTFQQDASYNRVLIWNFGTAEVMQHPLLGLGLQDWDRPDWMGASVDNFWLLRAMRHGLPGFLLLFAMTAIIAVQLIRNVQTNPDAEACRKGILVSMIGIWISIITVDLWNASYAMLTLFYGSGMWLLERRHANFAPAAPSDRRESALDGGRAVPIIGGRARGTANFGHERKLAPRPPISLRATRSLVAEASTESRNELSARNTISQLGWLAISRRMPPDGTPE